MAFVSWAAEASAFKDFLSGIESDFKGVQSYTTAQGQTKTYKSYQDMIAYANFLDNMASKEAAPSGRSIRVFSSAGTGGR